MSTYDPLAGHVRYRKLRSINEGTFGFVDLAQDLAASPDTNPTARVAVKFLERGPGVNKATLREIINHRLCAGHPHIVRFQEVFLTPRYLAIVMEYASGGDMFEYVLSHREQVPVAPSLGATNGNGGGTAAPAAPQQQTVARGLPEPVARAFFQELVVAMQFCHELGIANRDIKLENALLDDNDDGGGESGDDGGGDDCGSDGDDERMTEADNTGASGPASTSGQDNNGGASSQQRQQQRGRRRQQRQGSSSRRPSLKICDFGYSKNEFVDSRPKSVSGTPDYIAPEVLLNDAYDGKKADIWSCGVMLYVMLTGSLPFAKRGDERANNLVRLQQMFPRIVAAEYERPAHVSPAAIHLLGRLLTADPATRVTLAEVAAHPWFREGLPPGLATLNATLLSALEPAARGLQSVAEIEGIVHAATRPGAPPGAAAAAGEGGGGGGGGANVAAAAAAAGAGAANAQQPPTPPPPPPPPSTANCLCLCCCSGPCEHREVATVASVAARRGEKRK